MPTLVEVNKGEAGTGTEAGRWPACGTVPIATYNVRDGRREGEDGQLFLDLCLAARAMEMMGADVAFVQETKIVDPMFATCEFEGYSILVATADSKRRGRWPFWRRSGMDSGWRMRRPWGPTSFHLI